jgi:HPt (histidine-containing phosphotransfer) domain-containing protein
MRNLSEDVSQCLAWKWNWFRQGLVEGANDFSSLAAQSSSGADIAVWRALEDDSQGLAHRLAEALRSAELPQVRIHKPLQWFFRRHLGAASPGNEIDRVTAVRVMLWRLFRQMEDSLKSDGVSGELANGFSSVVRDLRSLVDQLTEWLEQQPGTAAQECLDHNREVDRLVVHELRPFEEVLWQMPGLGRSRDVAGV